MLSQISIQNFALVESLELDLDQGMTVFTGETGAGKSILIGALELALGARADTGVIRPGSTRAEISASFDIGAHDEVHEVLRELALDSAEGDCVLRRQVNADGRSRAFVNGIPTTRENLARIGDLLVDIHGQHAHQSLLHRDSQRQLLDGYADNTALLTEVAGFHQDWRQAHQALQELNADVSDRAAEIELLRYQVRELEEQALEAGELEQLEQEHRRLSNLQQVLEQVQQAQTLLNDESGGALAGVQAAGRTLQGLLPLEAALEPSHELIQTAAIQLDEALSALRHYLDSAEPDPLRQQELDQRLADLHELARKHHCAMAELPARLRQLRQRLETLTHGEERHAALEQQLQRSQRAYHQAATRLHEARAKAAPELAAALIRNMRELGMPDGAMEIRVSPLDPERPPAPNGNDRVDFLVSTNPGQPPAPLSKVASGGELSRISLAIQVIAAAGNGVPTLIFDEVDVGIGGRVAEIVGQQLRQLSARRQVLCVTHLAQVAALGQQHLRVSKEHAGGGTHTRVQALGPDQRIDEIARMMGGLEITAQTLAHARDMLARAGA